MLVESNDFSDTQLDSGFLSLKVFYAPIIATEIMKRLCFWQWRDSGAVKWSHIPWRCCCATTATVKNRVVFCFDLGFPVQVKPKTSQKVDTVFVLILIATIHDIFLIVGQFQFLNESNCWWLDDEVRRCFEQRCYITISFLRGIFLLRSYHIKDTIGDHNAEIRVENGDF